MKTKVNTYLSKTGERVHFVGYLNKILDVMFEKELADDINVDVFIDSPKSDVILYNNLRIDGISIEGYGMGPRNVYDTIKEFITEYPEAGNFVRPSDEILKLVSHDAA